MKFTNNEIEKLCLDGSLIKEFPQCTSRQSVKDALDEMNTSGLGFCIITGDSIGILTDGDLRRNISKGSIPLYAFLSKELKNVGSIPCKYITYPVAKNDVTNLAKSGISYVPVLDQNNKCIFVIDVKVFTLNNA